MYKVTNGLSSEIMNEVSQLRGESHYNLFYTSQFTSPPIRSVYNGRECASHIGPKIRELILPPIRQIAFLWI